MTDTDDGRNGKRKAGDISTDALARRDGKDGEDSLNGLDVDEEIDERNGKRKAGEISTDALARHDGNEGDDSLDLLGVDPGLVAQMERERKARQRESKKRYNEKNQKWFLKLAEDTIWSQIIPHVVKFASRKYLRQSPFVPKGSYYYHCRTVKGSICRALLTLKPVKVLLGVEKKGEWIGEQDWQTIAKIFNREITSRRGTVTTSVRLATIGESY